VFTNIDALESTNRVRCPKKRQLDIETAKLNDAPPLGPQIFNEYDPIKIEFVIVPLIGVVPLAVIFTVTSLSHRVDSNVHLSIVMY
jgi:hypothetical protein